uniref:WRKY domain-containing protein n=1 Tax=Cucumis melo TaxID=3656 RepID=A0A9I9E8M2_CUCME
MSYNSNQHLTTSESDLSEQPGFEFTDWMFDGWLNENSSTLTDSVMYPVYQEGEVDEFVGNTIQQAEPSSSGVFSPATIKDCTAFYISRSSGDHGREREVRERFAFKTKSEVEILDDGFKWRKYGKKMVKNSPNPSVKFCPKIKCSNARNIRPKMIKKPNENKWELLQMLGRRLPSEEESRKRSRGSKIRDNDIRGLILWFGITTSGFLLCELKPDEAETIPSCISEEMLHKMSPIGALVPSDEY